MKHSRGSHSDDINDTEPCYCEEEIKRAETKKEILDYVFDEMKETLGVKITTGILAEANRKYDEGKEMKDCEFCDLASTHYSWCPKAKV